MSEQAESKSPGRTAAEEIGRSVDPGAGLDHLLHLLAAQIAEADKRQADTVRGIQSRLTRLGDQIDSTRSELHPDHAGTLEQIEDSMAELRNQFSGDISRLGVRAPGSTQADANDTAPVPTRSDVDVDDDDAQGGGDGRPALEPWDRDSAEAFARHLEAAYATSPVSAAPPALVGPRIAEREGRSADRDRYTTEADGKRDGLEQRLADIASRVEQSLAVMKPESSLLQFGQRFDDFEARVAALLADVATQSDIAGLFQVEQQIGELSRRLDRTTAQLARLDRIEAQLGELHTKLGDQHVLELFGDLVPTEEDLVRFAEQAAGMAVDRVRAQLTTSDGDDDRAAGRDEGDRSSRQVTALEHMLVSFVEDRRRGEASTAEALDSVQTALQLILDRVDCLDTAAIPAHHVARAIPEVRPTIGPDTIDVPDFTEQDRTVRNATPPAPPAIEAMLVPERPEGEVRLERFQEETPQTTLRSSGSFQTPSGEPLRAKVPVDRKQMIAMARQAAENARTAAAQNNKAKHVGLKQRLFGSGGTDQSRDKSAVRSHLLLVASIFAFLLAGSLLVLGPRFRPAVPSAERTATPPPAPAAEAEKKASGKAPALIEEESPATTPAPNRQGMRPAEPESEAFARAEKLVQRLDTQTRSRPDASPVNMAEADANRPDRSSLGVPGIAVQGGEASSSATDLMRVRQRLHLARMSEQTAQNAARHAVVQTTSPADGLPETAQSPTATAPSVELPPLQIGPNSLRVAAAKGDASAQFEVAARLAEAKGIKQNFEQAAVWYQRAAMQGLPQAQYRLATLYERGMGVKADAARARLWYGRAAEQGNVKAMHNLAVLTAGDGGRGQADYATAAQWFGRAAAHGVADSQYNLAVLHESGHGVTRDLGTAYTWYTLAARGGDAESARRRDRLKATLDAPTLAAAERAVADWRQTSTDAASNDARVAGEAWKARAQASP